VSASVERIRGRILGLCLLAAVPSWLAGWPGTRGLVVGAAVVLASLWLFERLFLAAIVQGRRRLAIGLSFVKLAALLTLGWMAFSAPEFDIDPLGFAVGVTCLPVAALWEALATRD